MRILFITISFHEYVDAIIDSIKSIYKCDIDVFYTTFKKNSIISMIDRFFNGKIYKAYLNYKQYQNYLKIKNNNYDLIFILNAQDINITVFDELSQKYKCKKILYLWDSIRNNNSAKKIVNRVDEVYSFDKDDCKKFGFKFLHLFFTKQFLYDGEKKDIDLFAVGTFHTNRIKLYRYYANLLEKMAKTYFLKIVATYKQLFLETFTKSIFKKNIVTIKKIALEDTADKMKKSKCTLDISLMNQSGLSMRIVESLASKCKVITNNSNIIDYEFYSKNNFFVIGSDDDNKLSNFLDTEYEDINKNIVSNYSLDNWVKAIFDECLGEK